MGQASVKIISMDRVRESQNIVYLFILSSIFILNDFLYIFAKSYIDWLSIDYGSRALAVFIIAYLIISKKAAFSDFGFVKINLKLFISWAVLLSVSGVFIAQALPVFLAKVIPGSKIFFPEITSQPLKIFDLTFGVFLVSITEESIFRGYCASVLGPRIKSQVAIILASSAVFGLSHWSYGLNEVISTALWGVLPMVSVLKTRSILPAFVAHYLTDFCIFLR